MEKTNSSVIVEKLIYGGSGLARVDGEVVTMPYVLPGERASIGSSERRSGIRRAPLVGVEEPSLHRVLPKCRYFGRCGGCQYQHSGYAYQLEQKVAILREVLRRVGKLEAPAEIGVVSGPEWEYRNRTQLHVGREGIGYLEAGSHRLCPIDHCPISSPRLNEVIGALAKMTQDRRWPRFVRSIELFTNGTELQINVVETERPVARRFFDWCAESLPGPLAMSIDYPAAGFLYKVGPKSFFQVNRFLVDRLVETVVERLSGERVLDLYAGVGLFSLPLARSFRTVTAVESGTAAIADLEANAARAGVPVTAVRAGVEEYLASFDGRADAVICDPPRAGMGKRVAGELIRLRARQLVIVACDPATLARDLALLLAGGYRVDNMVMVDLFPQTFHLETIVRLSG